LKNDGKAVIVHFGYPDRDSKNLSSDFPDYMEFSNLEAAMKYIEDEFVEIRSRD